MTQSHANPKDLLIGAKKIEDKDRRGRRFWFVSPSPAIKNNRHPMGVCYFLF